MKFFGLVEKYSHLKKALLLLVIAFFSVNTYAVAKTTLIAPEALLIKEVDGKKVSKSFFDKTTKVELAKGSHVVVLQYEDIFENLEISFDSYDTIKSKKFMIKFVVENQQQVMISTPEIGNLAAAKEFVQSPKVLLVDEKKQKVPFSYQSFARYKAKKELAEMKALANESTVSAPKVVPNVTIAAPVSMNMPSSTASTQASTQTLVKAPKNAQMPQSLSMLKFWWNNASKKEQQIFKTFIQENSK